MSEPLKENIPQVEKAIKAQKLVGVKGMNDILPPDSARWEWLEQQVRALMARYAYRNVRLPILEPTALFVRGLGEVTDIVEKEMYSFEDRLNGEQLTLRPEGTAGLALWLSTTCYTKVASVCITWAPCSAMSVPNAVATASFTKSVPRCWVLVVPRWTLN